MKPWTILALTGGLCFVAPFAPILAQTPVNQCGQVLSKPGDYVLTIDIGCGDQTGIVISASRIHLNTASHSVSVIGTALVINDGLSHISIDGGGSLSGGAGVGIGAAQDIMLNNVSLFGSSSYASGIALGLGGANRVKVTNSTIGAGGCFGGGPAISGTVTNGLFSHNTTTVYVCDNKGGIGLDGANNTIRDNTINVESDSAYGISVTSSNTLIEGNTITLPSMLGGAFTPNKLGINLIGDSN